MKSIKFLILIIISMLVSSCTFNAEPVTVIGFKLTGGAGTYDSSIAEARIGERLYFIIKNSVITNRNEPRDFVVQVRIPNIEGLIIEQKGGVTGEKITQPTPREIIVEYKIRGKREKIESFVEFAAFPAIVGAARIYVKYFDSRGRQVGNEVFQTIWFVE
jgi:hypothetical protein